MFDILMYLFETYVHNDVETMVDQKELTEELSRAGFQRDAIQKALNWIERLSVLQDEKNHPYLASSTPGSFRIYLRSEQQKLNEECRGFILFLEQIQILTAQTREIVIERVMELDSAAIDLEDLKWVILMVLFNVPGSESAYQQMEQIIFDPAQIQIH
ncbi:DUF494 family protein [Dongshaea marina]|uniref:DUF494 family protein n=1 Tax=Dongshaea marina TaxID=2047966 RepID=UPI000D3E816F|nr:DUF494 family protein [Dongshaea marina]